MRCHADGEGVTRVAHSGPGRPADRSGDAFCRFCTDRSVERTRNVHRGLGLDRAVAWLDPGRGATGVDGRGRSGRGRVCRRRRRGRSRRAGHRDAGRTGGHERRWLAGDPARGDPRATARRRGGTGRWAGAAPVDRAGQGQRRLRPSGTASRQRGHPGGDHGGPDATGPSGHGSRRDRHRRAGRRRRPCGAGTRPDSRGPRGGGGVLRRRRPGPDPHGIARHARPADHAVPGVPDPRTVRQHGGGNGRDDLEAHT